VNQVSTVSHELFTIASNFSGIAVPLFFGGAKVLAAFLTASSRDQSFFSVQRPRHGIADEEGSELIRLSARRYPTWSRRLRLGVDHRNAEQRGMRLWLRPGRSSVNTENLLADLIDFRGFREIGELNLDLVYWLIGRIVTVEDLQKIIELRSRDSTTATCLS
jgi:hypothetical protein